MVSIFRNIIIFIATAQLCYSKHHHQEKRSLIFPRGNPTRHQFIAGIGTPIDISPESMTVGYVLKAQYFLPYNESHLYPTRFEKRDIGDDHRRFMTYDTTKSGIDEYSDENESLNDNARWSIYQILSLQLQKSFKVDGMKCIQKYICEATQSSFSYKSGLLGEILHILLVPSTTTLERNDYTYAEDIGRKNINCQRAFATCELPLLNYFSSLL